MDKKLIGKGTFTKAYRISKTKVLLVSCDPIKECMAMDWFPSSRLFPTVKFRDNNSQEYIMQYYDKPKSLKKTLSPRDYELYQILRKLHTDFSIKYSMGIKEDLWSKWHKCFNTIPNKFWRERKALKEALDACANYGYDIGFEISPRNVAVKNGKLILLDCFFIQSKLDEIRSSKNLCFRY